MIVTRRVLCLLLLSCVGLWCATAQAQQGAAKEKEPIDPKMTRVTLGGSSGTPGDSVVVPIYFTPGEGLQLGRLKIEVTFVSANLKFDKVDRGIAAEMGDVEFKSDVKIGKNDKGVETTTFMLDATGPTTPSKPISAGLLGYITLKISESGRPASITLRASAEGVNFGPDKTAAVVKSFDSEVEVLAPGTQPAVACFFFSH